MADPSGAAPAERPYPARDLRRRERACSCSAASGILIHGDTWAWDGIDWRDLAPAHAPQGADAAMTYDPDRERVVLFGGFDAAGAPLADTREFDGVDWVERTVATALALRAPAPPWPTSAAARRDDLARRRGVLAWRSTIPGDGTAPAGPSSRSIRIPPPAPGMASRSRPPTVPALAGGQAPLGWRPETPGDLDDTGWTELTDAGEFVFYGPLDVVYDLGAQTTRVHQRGDLDPARRR
ncbi:MAG: hypothetical protein R2939_12610 [Kofleriaceae bacterium]